MKKKIMIWKKETPIWINQTPQCKKFGWLEKKIDEIEVEVLAIVGKYAMVKRRGSASYIPIVVSVKELGEI
jgi:hypothetical protein